MQFLKKRLMCAIVACVTGTPVWGSDFDQWTDSATYELVYRVDLTKILDGGADSIRVWLPMPAQNQHQQLLSAEIESPWPSRKTRDRLGNRFVYLEPRAGPSQGSVVVMKLVVTRAPSDGIRKNDIRPGGDDPKLYTGPQRRIPLDGVIRKFANQAAAGRTTVAERIRADYDHVIKTMRYSKHGEGWGRGDAVWACDSRYGNCTDFHSVFIGMARAQGIPARFVIGFSIPAEKTGGTIAGYHCWAEAFDPQWGWRPVDASEAWKTKRFDDYFGKLPSDRVAFTTGRDLALEPPQQGEPLNYFICPYVEVDGKPTDAAAWSLSFERQSVSSQPK